MDQVRADVFAKAVLGVEEVDVKCAAVSRKSATRWAGRLDVQFDVGELCFDWQAFVAETKTREANNNASGNRLVAGVRSQPFPSAPLVSFSGVQHEPSL